MNKLIIDSVTRLIIEIKNNNIICDDGKHEQLLSDQLYNDADGYVTDSGIAEIFASGDTYVTRFTYNGVWHKTDVVSNAVGSGKIKGVKALTVGLYKNLFYSVYKDGKNILVHHIMGSGIDKVSAVDYLSSRCRYTVFCDGSGNINIWYINETEELCSAKYIWSQKEYSQKELYAQNVLNLCAVPCKSGDIYIAVVQKNKGYNEVCFKAKSDENFAMLGFGVDFNCDVAVVSTEGAVYVQWIDSKGCAETVSYDGGKTFEHPSDIHNIKSALCKMCAYRCVQNYNVKTVDLCISGGKMLLHESAIIELLKKETENE